MKRAEMRSTFIAHAEAMFFISSYAAARVHISDALSRGENKILTRSLRREIFLPQNEYKPQGSSQ